MDGSLRLVVLSVVMLKKPLPSPLLATSVGVITAGVFIASLGDLEFDGHAYTMGILSVFAQVSALFRPHRRKAEKLSSKFQR